MTIFWCPSGPLLSYENGTLTIEDLNPEIKTKWQMSRTELLKIGYRFIKAALRG